jgi:hypothetical protein
MAQGKPRDLRKERQWRRWIRIWGASGLSIQAFCARQGLAQASFYYWRRELDRRDAAPTTFVPVQVVSEAAPRSSGSGTALEVLLAGGRAVRVCRGFDATTLRQVLAVLEETPC